MMLKVVVIILAALALGAGLWFGLEERGPNGPVEIGGIYLTDPKPVPDFTLTGSTGAPFTPADFQGKWSFLYFGYTYCPDACPLTLGQLNAMDKLLDEKNLNQDIAYLLISVDPRRDTPERLAEYTRFFNPRFAGATGAPEQLNRLAQSFGVYYSVPDKPEDPENYLVDHSSAVLLVNPSRELQALFTPPHDPAKMAADFAVIRDRYHAEH